MANLRYQYEEEMNVFNLESPRRQAIIGVIVIACLAAIDGSRFKPFLGFSLSVWLPVLAIASVGLGVVYTSKFQSYIIGAVSGLILGYGVFGTTYLYCSWAPVISSIILACLVIVGAIPFIGLYTVLAKRSARSTLPVDEDGIIIERYRHNRPLSSSEQNTLQHYIALIGEKVMGPFAQPVQVTRVHLIFETEAMLENIDLVFRILRDNEDINATYYDNAGRELLLRGDDLRALASDTFEANKEEVRKMLSGMGG
ncbi:MAG: hypothetical protein CL920_20840 [Deltaproteobacteria bacterium]|nr:hypothetical protein [Deltaproteobacteria bacterium]MBU51142.1 hypothetical protein [Deltaproteobacteria bacterium]|tara:strand:+ start:6683 stop:7447 length:765 start_codon:yes stop_codon:yes gene_type:complete